MRYRLLILPLVFLVACTQPDAQRIVDRSVDYYNMEKLQDATLEFKFRNFQLRATQGEGKFKYERMFTDSTGKVHDILTNDGFKRTVNGEEQKLDKEQIDKYSRSVNALFYFVYLPLKLNDQAVNKKYLGETLIKNKPYHKLEISFTKDGGGEDHEDIYYYWFDTADYSMDHFAYSTGGNRFRSVSGTHEVNGVKFQDYINYQSPAGDSLTPVHKYDSLYSAGKLRELSKIEMENIVVR
ncbi:MAG TPA: DUF6503 family protein [Daejeonella sp.]|nr:DUF6503 family protein [Daejeonella sp.]